MPPQWRPALGTELKKIRALLAIDTEADDLKASVLQDMRNIKMILDAYVPDNMRGEITVLEGKQVTRQAILDHYRRMPLVPDETLLFFYAGHGAIDNKGDHFLLLQKGKDPLYRKDVVQAMKSRKPGLVVLLTDCCSIKLKTRLTSKHGDRLVLEPRPHPVIRCLFFQHRGVVNITAAQDGAGSWGDDRQGGIFTRSLCGLLKDDLKNLDSNKDHFLSWKEFFSHLERKTEETYEKFCEQSRTTENYDPKKEQRTQKPRFFGPMPEPLVPLKNDNKTYAVVTLVNRTGRPLVYRYRWNRDEQWKDGRIDKDGKQVHQTLLRGNPADGQLPRLEVDIPSEKTQGRLRAFKWTGAGARALKDGNQIELFADK